MPETPVVRVGQVWADNDPRGYGRKVRVVEVDDTHATVELHAPRAVGHQAAKPGRRTRIRLDRFRPTSTGYRLVSEAAVAERIRGYPGPDTTVWHRLGVGHDCDGQCDFHPIACSTDEGIVLPPSLRQVPVDLDEPGQRWCTTCQPTAKES